MAIRYIEQDRTFWLDTEHTSYLLAIVDQENFVGHVYYGRKLQYTGGTTAPVYLMRMGEAPFVPSKNNRERVSFLDSFPMEYPGNGLGDYRESAISVRTAQGHVGVQLQYVSHEIVKSKPALPGLPSTFPGEEDCDALILHLADPVIGLTADLLWPLILIGLLFSSQSSMLFLNLGIIAFSLAVLFQIVTLPVEFNASSRAIRILGSSGMLYEDEVDATKKVLSAAALTYVAGAASAILQLLRIILLANSRRD